MRKYERSDCEIKALEGQELKVIDFTVPMGVGEMDSVLGFKDNENRISYVPPKSKIIIDDKEYKIVLGKTFSQGGPYGTAHSATCLVDNSNAFHSLYNFLGKKVKVVEINRFKISRLIQNLLGTE